MDIDGGDDLAPTKVRHANEKTVIEVARELELPDARFAFAEGDEGMVMCVFMLPTFNVVFKIIRDRFGAPKTTTRRGVSVPPTGRARYKIRMPLPRAGSRSTP